MVALGGTTAAPLVLRRGRMELCNRGVPREGQPYHAAADMKLEEAREFLDECALTASAMAAQAIRQALDDLSAKGYRIIGSCVLQAAGRPLPSLEKVLAAHPLIHTAEGEFFRRAVRQGCEACGLTVRGVKERELPAGELAKRVADLGKLIGPPWRQDEKLCATAAWLMLHG
jgi:hypothetical protein